MKLIVITIITSEAYSIHITGILYAYQLKLGYSLKRGFEILHKETSLLYNLVLHS